MTKRLRIDREVVAPWEVGALEVFSDNWEHVLSSALMYSVKSRRRRFKETDKVFKQAHASIKRFENETLTLEAIIDMVAVWCGTTGKTSAEDLVLAWAADPLTANVVAADTFGRALFVAISNRPQMALPM